jgi:hypothetical protein
MKEYDVAEKRWTEMTADEQVPPWSLLVDQALLREQLEAHDQVAKSEGDTSGLGPCVCLEDETGVEVSVLCPEHGNGAGL